MTRFRARGCVRLAVWFVALGASLGAGACKGDSACEARLAAMQRTFEAIPPGAAMQQETLVDPAFPLLRSARGEVLRSGGPVVRLAADGSAGLEGGASHMAAEPVLAEATQRLAQAGNDRVLYLAIAPGVALGPHRALLRQLGERASLRVLVREAAGEPTGAGASPAVAARLAALRATPLAQRPMQMAEALRAAAGDCKPLVAGLEGLATVAPQERQAALLELARSAVAACGCEGVDVEGLSALIWTMMMGDEGPLRWLPMLPGPAGVELPMDARTGDLLRLLEVGPAIALPA